MGRGTKADVTVVVVLCFVTATPTTTANSTNRMRGNVGDVRACNAIVIIDMLKAFQQLWYLLPLTLFMYDLYPVFVDAVNTTCNVHHASQQRERDCGCLSVGESSPGTNMQ